MATIIPLEDAKARARALRPYVRSARRAGVRITGRGAQAALSGEVSPQQLVSGENTETATSNTSQQITETPKTPLNTNREDLQSRATPQATFATQEILKETSIKFYDSRISQIEKEKNLDKRGIYYFSRELDTLRTNREIERANYEKRTVKGGFVEVKALSPTATVRQAITSSLKTESFKVTKDVNPKLALFIEEKASNPYLTAAEITALRYVPAAIKTAGVNIVTKVGLVKGTTAVASTAVKGGILRGLTQAATTAPRGLGLAAGTYQVVTDATKFGRISDTEASILSSSEAKTAISEAYALQASQQKGFFNQAKFGVSQFLAPQEQFKASLIQTGVRQGFTNERLDTLVSGGLKTRTAQGYGEISGLLAAGVAGERAGRIAQRTIFTKYGTKVAGSFGKAATLGAISVAPAGFIEGASSEFVIQQSRSESLNLKRIGTTGLYGAGTAATLGGVITGGIYSNKKFLTKAATTFGNVADIYEYPADRLTDLGTKGFIKGLSPTVALTPSFSQSLSPSNSLSLTQSNVLSNSQQPTLNIAESKNFGFSKTPTPTNPFTFTNTPTNPFTESQTNPFTNTNTITNVNPFTNTNTLTTTNTLTNTPTYSINYRFPAPLPIPTSFGGGGGSINFRRGSPKIMKSFQYKPTVFSILTSKRLKL